jgi:Xaa-Pro aminopeptidase
MLKEMLASIRELKSDEEVGLLQKAIDITCNAQIELMQNLEPGMAEYQAEALVEYVFKKEGAEQPGFPSILGGGENSCILHYTSNRKTMYEGELLVVDIGAEYHGYTADITRTMPVSGIFTREQGIIYDIVLKAQMEGIESCMPGNKFWSANEKAIDIIATGLMDNGIITRREDYRNYFMHGTSHYLGLDVHDVGLYGSLEPGNVLTVEPGIYIPIGSNCDKKWWNIGVRIEDDILITKTGYKVLSDCVPKSIAEIEQIMNPEKTQK